VNETDRQADRQGRADETEGVGRIMKRADSSFSGENKRGAEREKDGALEFWGTCPPLFVGYVSLPVLSLSLSRWGRLLAGKQEGWEGEGEGRTMGMKAKLIVSSHANALKKRSVPRGASPKRQSCHPCHRCRESPLEVSACGGGDGDARQSRE